ncbi:MSC1 Meiotic sister chromatid recombination protein 1 [Candida maltosa Xu316]|uniref:Meiotic sister chromatid recombination protein 1 n=1 Tax=Candida maltosa (strain Xu316) TaxID=1245528 RepID=M3IRZ3_CANMX|nr:hypothetical protein G210_5948 [Candida maltosa Xu316]
MKVSNIWVYLLAIPTVFANFGFDQWTNSDLKQFLKDRKVAFNENWENPKLISLANEEAKKLEKKYQQVSQQLQKQLNPPDNSIGEYLNFDYLFGKKNDKYSIKEWIFESWPVVNLQKLLTNNGIKFDEQDSRQDLVDKLKSSFDDLARKHHGSNFYPGTWLFEDSWSTDDAKNWLESYGIEFNPKATKNDLIEKLKEFSYQATYSIKDSKSSLLNSLDLFDKSIFDSYGQVKDEFFETWNYSQLREWLYLHGFIDTKPGIYVEDLDKEKLVEIAQTYKKYLLGDIHTWLANEEKEYHPWLTRTEQNSRKKSSNLINDTFFVGIDNWSKDKLREFLDARKVPYSIFTTKHQLIQLVKKHKFDPIHVETFAWVVDDISTDSVKQWLKEQGETVEGTRNDIISAFKQQFEQLKNGAFKSLNNIDSQIRFYTPDIGAYKSYLQKNLDPAEYKKLTEDQITEGFKVVDAYYKSAGASAKEKFQDTKYSAEDALDQIEQSSYEYSIKFLKELEQGKTDAASFIKDAQIASSSYVNSLIETLSQNLNELHEGALDKVTSWWYGAKAGFHNHVDEAHQVAVDLNEKAGEKYSSIQKEASSQYESIGTQVSKSYDEAVKDAGKKYEQAQEHASKIASDVSANAAQAKKDLGEGYIKYKTTFGDFLENSYRYFLYGLSLFNTKVLNTAKSAEKEVTNQWDAAVRTFSNADLKTYLRSYGYSYEWLSALNRRELINLASFQNKLFSGYKGWEKSVGDVLNEASEDLKIKLGLKKKPEGFIAQIRSVIGI